MSKPKKPKKEVLRCLECGVRTEIHHPGELCRGCYNEEIVKSIVSEDDYEDLSDLDDENTDLVDEFEPFGSYDDDQEEEDDDFWE